MSTPTQEIQEAKQFVDRRTSNASAVMNPTIEPMDWMRAARILRNDGMELEERLSEARARVAELEAAQTQQPLDRPDKPGCWWKWTVDRWLWWEICEHEGVLGTFSDDGLYHDPAERGQWLPATPPPVPEKEDAK